MHLRIRSIGLALIVLAASAGCDAPRVTAAPPAKATESKRAELKKPAPDFKLRDTEGRELKLSSLRGKVVVLEWFNPECPFVKHAHTKGPLKDLARRRQSDKLVWLSINSGAPGKQGNGLERNQRAKVEYGIVNELLLDEGGEIGHAYGAEKTPHLYVIDPKGVLVYRGGLDNAPMGVVDEQRPRASSQAGALEPYLENALDDVLAGKPVRLPETPAYGCGVKYAD